MQRIALSLSLCLAFVCAAGGSVMLRPEPARAQSPDGSSFGLDELQQSMGMDPASVAEDDDADTGAESSSDSGNSAVDEAGTELSSDTIPEPDNIAEATDELLERLIDGEDPVP